MKFKNRFIDLTKTSDVDKLAELHRQQSLGCTKRYQCNVFKFYEDEFHPLWHTFRKSHNALELKVNIRAFSKELKKLEASDYIWFDLKVKDDCVLAICQLNRKIRFVVASDLSLTSI